MCPARPGQAAAPQVRAVRRRWVRVARTCSMENPGRAFSIGCDGKVGTGQQQRLPGVGSMGILRAGMASTRMVGARVVSTHSKRTTTTRYVQVQS